MLSNKEKRLSQAREVFPNLDSPFSNHVQTQNYGVINNNVSNHINNATDGTPLKRLLNDRHSQSLSHEFSQIYMSNIKHKIASNTQGKKLDSTKHEHLPSLEEMNCYKKEALESKKQLFQLEKSIRFWNDSTEYWRNKWRKCHEEKTKFKDEMKQLKAKVNKLEHQLQVSETKRNNLSDEVKILNENLSKFYRFEDENNNSKQRPKNQLIPQQQQSLVHCNSDRRVDYRKQRRKKDLPKDYWKKKESSSSELEELDRRIGEMKISNEELNNHTKSATRKDNSKIIYRNHERLFDKKIMNRKRFSQVVMLDEDEIFQLNQDIPTLVSNKSFDNNTLKSSNNNNSISNGETSNEQEQYNGQQRFIDYVLEEENSNDDIDEEQIEAEFKSNIKLLNDSNMSTMATNSECPNVGSLRKNNDDDDDSLRFVPNQTEEQPDFNEDEDDEV